MGYLQRLSQEQPSFFFYPLIMISVPLRSWQKESLQTTWGILDPPLGNTRLHVVKLLASSLGTNNIALQNEIIELSALDTMLVSTCSVPVGCLLKPSSPCPMTEFLVPSRAATAEAEIAFWVLQRVGKGNISGKTALCVVFALYQMRRPFLKPPYEIQSMYVLYNEAILELLPD